MTKMSSRQPREDFGLDDSSDLEDSWAAESVMFDASPVSRECRICFKMRKFTKNHKQILPTSMGPTCC